MEHESGKTGSQEVLGATQAQTWDLASPSAEGGREARKLPLRKVWRAAQSDPDVEAAAGTQPSWPPAPTVAAPVRTLDFCSRWPPPTSFSSQGTAGHPPRPGPPDPQLACSPQPGRRRNSLFPGGSRLPSPTARPSRSSQNPRPSAPLPGPQPYPGARGGGGGAGQAARLRTPHCSPPLSRAPRATPQEPRRPQLTALGSGKGGRRNPAPGDLTP